LADPLVEPSGLALLMVLSGGLRLSSRGCSPTLILLYLFYLTQRKKRQISAGLKNRGVQQFIGLYIFYFYLFIHTFFY
jgi:hypothetical protein